MAKDGNERYKTCIDALKESDGGCTSSFYSLLTDQNASESLVAYGVCHQEPLVRSMSIILLSFLELGTEEVLHLVAHQQTEEDAQILLRLRDLLNQQNSAAHGLLRCDDGSFTISPFSKYADNQEAEEPVRQLPVEQIEKIERVEQPLAEVLRKLHLIRDYEGAFCNPDLVLRDLGKELIELGMCLRDC
jgi:hypothetical protein